MPSLNRETKTTKKCKALSSNNDLTAHYIRPKFLLTLNEKLGGRRTKRKRIIYKVVTVYLYNMGDAKQKKPRYKRWWAITLFIIIGLVIIGNLFGGNNSSSTQNTNNNVANTQQKQESTQVSLGSDFCEFQNLRLVIPDRIDCRICSDIFSKECNETVRWSGLSDGSCLPKGIENPLTHNMENIDYTWKDGTDMGFTGFNKASSAGENTHYFYNNGRLMYKKTPISPDGTIGSRISYEIGLAIDPNDKTDGGYKIVQYRCCESYCTDENYKMIG